MRKDELRVLKALSENMDVPKGMGGVMKQNFLKRNWVVRAEREYDYGPDRYAITETGLTALRQEEE